MNTTTDPNGSEHRSWNSRKHEQGKQSKYWFAFHPHQKDTISKYPAGYVAFGCGSADSLIEIPAKEFVAWLSKWVTEADDRIYWHVRIVDDKSRFKIDTRSGQQSVDVTEFVLK